MFVSEGVIAVIVGAGVLLFGALYELAKQGRQAGPRPEDVVAYKNRLWWEKYGHIIKQEPEEP